MLQVTAGTVGRRTVRRSGQGRTKGPLFEPLPSTRPPRPPSDLYCLRLQKHTSFMPPPPTAVCLPPRIHSNSSTLMPPPPRLFLFCFVFSFIFQNFNCYPKVRGGTARARQAEPASSGRRTRRSSSAWCCRGSRRRLTATRRRASGQFPQELPQVSHGLRLQSPWRTSTATVSFGLRLQSPWRTSTATVG